MELPASYPDSPMESEDVAYPCKGCGEILEEGKAFELAGNRWHIDCFRCNTCGTLLDSDANLLLLGDGSLICNTCTYSCSACGNKIEDLAILTGDQAFCANCFKCRNCKKKIENLRYARTSQGIFCMECHEGLMARRRKKSAKNSLSRQKSSNNNTMLLDKSLPSLPPNAISSHNLVSGPETPLSDNYSETPTELPPISQKRPQYTRAESSKSTTREISPAGRDDDRKNNLPLPQTSYRSNRESAISQRSDVSGNGEGFFIPMALDPNPVMGPSPLSKSSQFDRAVEEAKSAPADGKSGSRDYFNAKYPHPTRKPSPDYENLQSLSHPPSRSNSRPGSGPGSPHIAFQEKGREPPSEAVDTVRKRSDHGSISRPSGMVASDAPRDTNSARSGRNGEAESEKFKLQEVPKNKKSGASGRNSKSDMASPSLDTSISNATSKSAPASAEVYVKEQHSLTVSSDSPLSSQPDTVVTAPSRTSQDSRPHENGSKNSPSTHSPLNNHLQSVPQRGDSLQKSGGQTTVVRKELGTPSSSKVLPTLSGPDATHEYPSSAPPATASNIQESPVASNHLMGGKTISKPMESPVSRSRNDTSGARTRDRPSPAGVSTSDSFVAPRASPLPPVEYHYHKARNESISTLQSDVTRNGDQPGSPLPRHSAGGEFSMEDDMARILGDDHQDHASFLRRVSNSVRHARSYSDRGVRLTKEPKWPKSPLNGSSGAGFPQEISSPASSSPETKEEVQWLRNELRRQQQKVVEKEQKISELEAALDGKTSIKKMNTELREKRSTMVVLDTQKEIVVRELEVLMDHISAAKKSNEPLDIPKMSNLVLHEFAESLQLLKESFTPQIEDLVQKRNDIIEEMAGLTQLKDKSMQEFEQLSVKNAQLAELNNQLVHQIQGLYKAGASASIDSAKQHPTGLGIYTHHHKERSNVSIDSREARPSIADSHLTGSTAVHDNEHEPATILTAPQVVNIRKGQPKRFNWKKGGQNVAKGVTKGLKATFQSTEFGKYQREDQMTEGIPYGAIPPSQDSPAQGGPRSGFFGNQKTKPPNWKASSNGSTPLPNAENASVLFGSELEQRCEYERNGIPSIVTRCIQEVQLRGMDVEGIYRKSGGNSQIQHIKEGFERNNEFDISDPDLDINAVTSALKQYFRKLPTPLVTYPVYDRLLDSTTTIEDNYRIAIMHSAINELPPHHRDVLEFLVFHLKGVVEREKENLMTSLNVAVVFAPTIMRPESVAREMSDMQAKNQAVQFLIENCHAVFMGEV